VKHKHRRSESFLLSGWSPPERRRPESLLIARAGPDGSLEPAGSVPLLLANGQAEDVRRQLDTLVLPPTRRGQRIRRLAPECGRSSRSTALHERPCATLSSAPSLRSTLPAWARCRSARDLARIAVVGFVPADPPVPHMPHSSLRIGPGDRSTRSPRTASGARTGRRRRLRPWPPNQPCRELPAHPFSTGGSTERPPPPGGVSRSCESPASPNTCDLSSGLATRRDGAGLVSSSCFDRTPGAHPCAAGALAPRPMGQSRAPEWRRPFSGGDRHSRGRTGRAI
jgi:hypothetical protein